MPNALHRTTLEYRRSVDPTELPGSPADWLLDPDLSPVAGQPKKYWVLTVDTLSLLDAAGQTAADAAELEASRDSTAAQLDQVEDVLRAFMLSVLDEINLHAQRITAILDAIDGANNLATVKTAIALIPDVPERSTAQLRTAIRNKLGS